MLSKETGKELNTYLVNYVIFDVETTGIDSDKDELIEISAVKVKGEEIIKEFDSFIKPSISIPAVITELTGITDNMVEQSPAVKDVLADFLEFIGDDVLVCHNAPFALSFLNRDAREMFGTVIRNDYIDTNHIAKKRLPRLRTRVLPALVDYYGINVAGDTGLLTDCHIVKDVYECLFHRRKAGADGIIELHCHTKMSEGKGLIAPDELIRYAYDKGYKAIAITDCGNVQAFPEAYRTWLKLWNEYEDGCRQKGEEADKRDFLKVIYGLEGNLLEEDGNVYPILLYAKNHEGIKNLYRIVTVSNLKYYDEVPLIPREYLNVRMDGLIVEEQFNDAGVFYIDETDKTAFDILLSFSKEKSGDVSRGLSDKYESEETAQKMEEIADQIEYVNPLREGRFIPEYPNADEELTKICNERVKEIFGNAPDFEVRKRLERELTAIKENGYAGIYMMWRLLVKKSLDEGYPTGIRGAVGSSFVAFLCGITDINPLSKENGGYQIPAEVFMGLNLDREPDIDINFGSNIRDVIQEYVGELPGVGERWHGGTITTMAEKTAERNIEQYFEENGLPIPEEKEMAVLIKKITGVKRGNGVHPGGIIVCPQGEEFVSFTPLTHPYPGKSITTEFDYHSIDDNLLKLDILGHIQYDMLHALQEKTGVKTDDIPLDDEEVLSLLCDVESEEIKDFPEFGSEYTRAIIKVARPKSFDDLVKISALAHGTDVWHGNQKELVEQGRIRLSDCIASRDDIMIYLMNMTMLKDAAYKIMDSVRKGKGLTDEQKQMMREADVPEWYIQVCEKIRYLFPKSHAVSYTMMAVRLAYYMVHYPDEYYESLSEVS